MAQSIIDQSAGGIGTGVEGVPVMDFRFSVLNGHAEYAREFVDSAVSAMYGVLVLRRGEEVARQFFQRQRDRAEALLVPSEYALGRAPHHGLAVGSLAIDFGGNRLRIEAAKDGQPSSYVTFSSQPRNRGVVWVPEQISVDGDEVQTVGQYASDPNTRLLGQERLLQASTRIGSAAVRVADLTGISSAPIQPQLHLSAPSNLT